MVKDVLDGLKMVSEGIKNVKEIAEAVRDGTNYLKAKHPQVRDDLKALVEELRKSLNVIKQASAILTNFRFAVAADAKGLELARFNNYFIKSKAEAQDLRNHIEDLRTHCSKVRAHATKITDSATAPGFARLFSLLGLNSPTKEAELGRKLDELAYEDFQVANSAEVMVASLEEALRDVQNALGSSGAMHPGKIPDAAALLAQYGPAFEEMESESVTTSREIVEIAKGLT